MPRAAFPHDSPSRSLADMVRVVVSRVCGRLAVSDRHALAGDLDLDEADIAELIAAVELALDVELSAGEAAAVVTVGDLVRMVELKRGVDRPAPGADEPLFEAIEDLVAGAAAAGEPIDIAAAAEALAGEHQGAGLTLADIAREIEHAALAAGAAIVAGNDRWRD